ncbi:DUF5988 family protein [Embleya sp. NPDC056538]|uniref:DUF5988 family protein n=1 Tax=Embleya sp. NPDC056538 TaxID=3345858 RepID=UPI0036BB28A5
MYEPSVEQIPPGRAFHAACTPVLAPFVLSFSTQAGAKNVIGRHLAALLSPVRPDAFVRPVPVAFLVVFLAGQSAFDRSRRVAMNSRNGRDRADLLPVTCDTRWKMDGGATPVRSDHEMQVALTGGILEMPAVLVVTGPGIPEKVSVEFRNGREHYEYTGGVVELDGVDLPLFRWSYSTRIAE